MKTREEIDARISEIRDRIAKKRTEIYALGISGAQLRGIGGNIQIEKALYRKGMVEIEKDRIRLEELLWVLK